MKIYLVGGAVRDKLLGLKVRDKDWLVVGSTINEMLSLGYRQVGNSFPVFLHPKTNEEYALARTEIKNGKGYCGFICDSSVSVTLEEDLFRRDLTINAIAIDLYGKIYDPYNGIQDLNNRLIKHVSFNFIDDPLRIFRVAQLYSRFYNLKFVIDDNTFKLLMWIVRSGELLYIIPERIWKETVKGLNSTAPSFYFLILYKCGALNISFPELIDIFDSTYICHYFKKIFKIIVSMNLTLDLRFVFLCLFFYKTFLVHEFFLNKNYLLKLVHLFCKRFNITKKFYILYKVIINILYLIYFYDRKQKITILIMDIFHIMNVWRHSFFLNKFLLFLKVMFFIPFKNKMLLKILDHYLLIFYQNTCQIISDDVIKLGYQGKYIAQHMRYLRIKSLELFMKKIFS